MLYKKTAVVFLLMQMFFAGILASAQEINPIYFEPFDKGFIQLNNLVVQSRTGDVLPAEIVAGTGDFVIMAEKASSINSSASSGATCYRYESESSSGGTAVKCPLPASSSNIGQALPAIYPPPAPPSYRVRITGETRLLLRDRTLGTLKNFEVGDSINVFGYYNANGTIEAYVVRNLSKPVAREFIQLNNVTLASVSGNTLAVVQETPIPCYYYRDGMAATRQERVCPMGVASFSTMSTTANVESSGLFKAEWMPLRKYIVIVDAQTVLLDRNRTRIALSDLRVGDKLNIYGDTADSGQSITADIVRDLSLPKIVTQETYSGKITQVNADGSFVFQTDSGRTLTVKNFAEAGLLVKIRGVLDEAASVISQVSQISISR